MSEKKNDTAKLNQMQAIALNILGEPASKANSRRLVHFHGISRLIKSKKALSYSEVFKHQAHNQYKGGLILEDVAMSIRIYYASRRPDLDDSLILDLLQGIVYKNDRQVKERHVYWGLDKENPRAEIYIYKL